MWSATPKPASSRSLRTALAGLNWDEEYKQSERLDLQGGRPKHLRQGMAYRDFMPAHAAGEEQSSAQGAGLQSGMRELTREESDRRAEAGEPFALRYRVPRGQGRTLRL